LGRSARLRHHYLDAYSYAHAPGATTTFCENSEVSPIDVPLPVPLVLVAVAVTVCPVSGIGLTQEKVGEFPLALVFAVVCATRICPSPWPEGSGAATKHWIV